MPCMIRGVSAAKRAPSWQDLRAMHSQKAICGAFRIHGAHILPKPARFGCMARESCQGGALFPSGAPSGMHGAKKLPRQGVRERIAVASCQQKQHFQPRKSPGCSFLPRLTRAHPRDAAVPCCGDARRRDGGVGAGRHWGAGLSAAERGIGAALSAR